MDPKSIGCIASSYAYAKALKAKLIKNYQIVDCQDKNATLKGIETIVVLGGDGFMLRILHRFAGKNIAIFGINCGSLGFLLNSFCEEEEDFFKVLSESVEFTMFPVFAMVESSKGTKKDYVHAFNEIYITRSAYQTAHLKLNINNISSNIVSDGILIATSQGSSAYNSSCGGTILPHGSDFLCVTPINLLKPKSMRSFIVDRNKAEITLDVLCSERREVQLCADFISIKNVEKVKILNKKDKYVRLLFRSEKDFSQKILEAQMCKN